VLPAPPEEVFAAWTDPDRAKQWMSPVGSATLTLDLRVGGRFRLVMAGEGMEIDHEGEYRAIEPPRLLQFTWRSRFTGDRDTLVTVRFEPHGDGQTEVLLTHEGLTEDEAASHSGGWDQILERLERHVR
jgi:uncharacterized protein YndB with AHSA1/START domain